MAPVGAVMVTDPLPQIVVLPETCTGGFEGVEPIVIVTGFEAMLVQLPLETDTE